ncbi:hypothetical protein R1sor_021751 [Riccia sorocarpa]|uniref:Leucine-rich repeat-containing N-terminal plant-type domain-containing protein n=1 Tax=Riccia sorocarpa TaxID=122646 RepID=A0ABD3GHX2_9MARC
MGFPEMWMAVTALILSVCVSKCGAHYQSSQCDANDQKALLEFKAGFITSGFVWTTWDPESSCCGWDGVVCTDSGRVQLLMLGEYWGRHGPYPSAERDPKYKGVVGVTLGELSELQRLDLTMVLFNGPMPDVFDKLKKLEELNIYFNNFSGSLPPSIGSATSLKFLKVDGNGYQWTFPNVRPAGIPSSFCQLKNLRNLTLTYFKLNGHIPDCFCKFHALTVLELNDNELEGGIPRCLGSDLRKLETIDLSGNRLSGDIPALLGLTRLKSIDLHGNKLSGSIPKEIGKLVHLQSLVLRKNSLSGAVPAAIGNLAQLTVLDLDYNSITRIPREIGKLSKLTYLSFRDNQLQGSLPPEIGNCGTQGEGGVYFEISNNKLSGPIPDVFGGGHFNFFFGQNNRFTGGFPLSLAMIGNVDVSNNRLSDLKQVGTLSRSPKLYYLVIANNRFSGPLPSWLESLVTGAKELSTLHLAFNKFTGPVPAYWFTLPYFYGVTLNASHNLLTGPLPSLSSSTVVSTLDLNHNRISGPIPSKFFGALLNSTFYLDLSFNQLSGSLPQNSGDFQNIYYLDLSDNKLTGKVPESIEKIPSLSYLDLSHNNFTGRVPYGVSRERVRQLERAAKRKLSGDKPRTGQVLSNVIVEQLYNNSEI